ncbi:MAG: 50S ribosomal protein L10 [Thermodesulfobacteriota bacterium]
MLSKAAKNEIIDQFSAVFKANPSVMLVEYKGLSVKEIEGLRTNLKDADTNLTVVKNTLLKIAAKDTDIEKLNDLLSGPTAIAVCESDPTAAAKVFVDTAKDLPSLVIKGGVVEGTVVSANEIEALSKLPSRQEMMAQLLGALTSPMSNLLGTLGQLQTQLLYALEAVKDKKEQGGEAAAPAEEKSEAPKEEAKQEESKAEAKEETPKEEAKEAEAKEDKAPADDAKEVEAKEEAPSEEAKEEAPKEEEKEEPKAEAEETAQSEEVKEENSEDSEEEKEES